jgi:hypothetical protein
LEHKYPGGTVTTVGGGHLVNTSYTLESSPQCVSLFDTQRGVRVSDTRPALRRRLTVEKNIEKLSGEDRCGGLGRLEENKVAKGKNFLALVCNTKTGAVARLSQHISGTQRRKEASTQSK